MGLRSIMLAGGVASPGFSPWDVSSLPANVVASDSNFTLTRSGGADATRIVAHPVARSSGKFALRFLLSLIHI